MAIPPEVTEAIEDRLARAAETGDQRPLVEPGALVDAQRLTAALPDTEPELPGRLLLARFHWERCQTLPRQAAVRERSIAFDTFLVCFLVGAEIEQVPTMLREEIVEAAFAIGVEGLREAMGSPDPTVSFLAVFRWRCVVRATPNDDLRRSERLDLLANSLQILFQRTGDDSVLREAIAKAREAVESSPAGPDRAIRRGNLAGALRLWFESTGDLAAIEEAVEHLEAALSGLPPDHALRAAIFNNLGNALRARFARTGAVPDLDRAVEIGRAMGSQMSSASDRAVALNNLTLALQSRYDHFGALPDLNEAIRAEQEALAITPADDIRRSAYLTILGLLFQTRFQRTDSADDITEAVRCQEEAARTMPRDHPDHLKIVNNLAEALRIRFGRTGMTDDLEKSIRLLRDVLRSAPADQPVSAGFANNLGLALLARHRLGGSHEDLSEALAISRGLVTATAPDDPEHVRRLSVHALLLQAEYQRTGSRADLEEAVSAHEAVADTGAAVPLNRVLAAQLAAEMAAPFAPDRAADLMEKAVRLMNEVAPRRLARKDQQHAIAEIAGLASDAAARALMTDASPRRRAERALGLLEMGRAVLQSQIINTRDDLTELHDREPRLAERFMRLRELLDDPGSSLAADHPLIADHGVDRHRWAVELSALLEEIRALDGFSSFARPPAMDTLLAQAADGPIAVVNVSRLRSDALLVTRNGVTSLPLPQLEHRMVIKQAEAFRLALRKSRDKSDPEQQALAQARLHQVLRWTWDTVASPVLHALDIKGTPSADAEAPRIWWIPCGPLNHLPLHAAGRHQAPGGQTVLDRAVSSYTPTIGALRYARERTMPPSAQDASLIVAMPTTPGVPGRLPHVRREAELLYARLPRPTLLQEHDGGSGPPSSAPTKAAVLASLPRCAVAHFACHGQVHARNPSQSRLLLHDHATAPLTVADLGPIDLGRARLAYLSACSTAYSADPDLIDEGIHLTSAFQLAGFRHVIGTQWQIDDAAAADVALSFYGTLIEEDGVLRAERAATALHQAVHELRESHRELPGIWAAYIHTGP